MNISFIGFGNMAKAIARGLAKQGVHTLYASSPSLSLGINKDKIHTHHDNKAFLKAADVLILAVKPAQMSTVLEEIALLIPPHCLLISVAAGLNLDWFMQRCKVNQAIIRTMPNTAAAIGMSATPLIANKHTNAEQKKWAETIFSSIGLTAWADVEEELDTFTALSGSGPAYVFLFMESMINAAVALGLKEPIARAFTLQTIFGAINLAQSSELSLSELRTRVTSPGGTTAAALQVLHNQLDSLLLAAMEAAKNRSHELGIVG